MRAVCVARHRFLSDHLARYFGGLGLETHAAVGLDEAREVARREGAALVLCDYDLLATDRLAAWESDPSLRVPVIAVSMTRRPDEVHLFDVNGVAGFLYLPTLRPDVARRVLAAAAPPVAPPQDARLPWGRLPVPPTPTTP